MLLLALAAAASVSGMPQVAAPWTDALERQLQDNARASYEASFKCEADLKARSVDPESCAAFRRSSRLAIELEVHLMTWCSGRFQDSKRRATEHGDISNPPPANCRAGNATYYPYRQRVDVVLPLIEAGLKP